MGEAGVPEVKDWLQLGLGILSEGRFYSKWVKRIIERGNYADVDEESDDDDDCEVAG